MNKSINSTMILGVVLDAGFLLLVAMSSEIPWIIAIFAPFLLISISGLIVTSFTPGRLGPLLVMIGAIIFVPLGLVAALGARKALDEIRKADFHKATEQ